METKKQVVHQPEFGVLALFYPQGTIRGVHKVEGGKFVDSLRRLGV